MSDKRKPAKSSARTKRAGGQLAEHDAQMDRVRASLTRLQDPEYIMKVIMECQELDMIPKDADGLYE
jgi:hypothetical protein